MREIRYRIDGDPVLINVVEHEEDLEGFRDFVRANLSVLAADSEATGLDTYAPGHRSRLWQFGNAHEAWTIPVELGGPFVEAARKTLFGVDRLWFQNGKFDLQEADKHLGVPMEDLWPKVKDTRIYAHLVDPRGREEGGIGHGLEELTAHYVGRTVADEVKGSMTALAKKFKTTKAKIYGLVDLWDEDYQRYSGMDPILAARLANKLVPLVPRVSKDLLSFEHELAEVCSYMERTGFLLDVPYTKRLSEKLQEKEEQYKEIAASYGVEKVGSNQQVAEALLRMGVKLTKKTDGGDFSVDKSVLGPLVEQGNGLAKAVFEAKKAAKWRTTWVDTFLATADEAGRCHASINALRARTARMSITGIPAQTLPASDWMIRRCFVADPGHSLASVDYKSQELRVLAALSGEPKMIRAFLADENLHLLTARAAFGDYVESKETHPKEYKAGKGTNFCVVFGGGWHAVHEQFGVPEQDAQTAVEAFWETYTEVGRYSKKLQKEARANGYVVTPSGRRLPVDESRPYAALNYVVQSTSRDVTARGILRLHAEGFTPYLRLPIHDEVVASLPREKAVWGAEQIGELMGEQMGPVYVGTDPEVPGKHWGAEYIPSVDDELRELCDREIKEAGLW